MPFIELTDGTTTITLTDTINHALAEDGWAPAVSALDEATLGGGGPYLDVEESLSTDLFSLDSGETGLLARLQGVNALLMQARRWAQGAHGVAPVKFRYQPDGSALGSPLEALVLGRAGESPVTLPSNLNDLAFVREVEGAGVAFLRRGALLAAEEAATPAAAVANPGLLTCTFAGGALPYPSPTWIDVGDLAPPSSSFRTFSGLIVVSDVANAIQILEAEAGTGSSSFASTADSANLARGGSVMRWTAPVGLDGLLTLAGGGAVTARDSLIQVWVAVRNTDQLAADIRLRVNPFTGLSTAVVYGDWISIPANGGLPQILSLGAPFPTSIIGSTIALTLVLELAGTSVGQRIDLDYVVVANVQRVAVVAHDPARISPGQVNRGIRIDPRVAEFPQGDVRITDGGANQERIGARGSPQLCTSGATLTAAYLVPTGAFWCHPTTAGTAAQTMTLNAGRRRAYLIPE